MFSPWPLLFPPTPTFLRFFAIPLRRRDTALQRRVAVASRSLRLRKEIEARHINRQWSLPLTKAYRRVRPWLPRVPIPTNLECKCTNGHSGNSLVFLPCGLCRIERKGHKLSVTTKQSQEQGQLSTPMTTTEKMYATSKHTAVRWPVRFSPIAQQSISHAVQHGRDSPLFDDSTAEQRDADKLVVDNHYEASTGV
uniref:Uncharacterized protein n=1 Tax=Eutreptiella gymnastica TaxID=73025 RepID=A0A7S4CZ64_9EUGL